MCPLVPKIYVTFIHTSTSNLHHTLLYILVHIIISSKQRPWIHRPNGTKCICFHFIMKRYDTFSHMNGANNNIQQRNINHGAGNNKPVVVIAGWLGCQIKALAKYVELYESIGFVVMTVVATPYMVSNTAQTLASSRAATSATTSATSATTSPLSHSIPSIHDLAHQIIQKLQSNSQYCNCTEIFFHVFSNGGCFLWEAIYGILSENNCFQEQSDDMNTTARGNHRHDHEYKDSYSDVTNKISGIIYDSAPGNYQTSSSSPDSQLLLHAFKYCTQQEQLQLKSEQFLQYLHLGHEQTLKKNNRRAMEYWNKMKLDPFFYIPALYLFSNTDKLAPFESLLSLVHYRQDKFGSSRSTTSDRCSQVKFVVFDHSPHCRHILTHPELYISSVKHFVLQNISQSQKRQQQQEQKQSSNDFTMQLYNIPYHRSRI